MWIFIVVALLGIGGFVYFKKHNNYTLIARNTTFIYEILRHDFKDIFPDKDTLLATCGVIDALVYITSGNFTVEDVKRGVLAAKAGYCRIGIATLDIFDNALNATLGLLDDENTSDLIAFIINLEALIFYSDSKVSTELILSSIKSKHNLINDVVRSAQKKYRVSGASPMRKKQVHGFMTGEVFADLRDKLGILHS